MSESFPLGTLITIGQSERLRPDALGVVFRVDTIITPGKKYKGKVMETPNGWEHQQISHAFVPEADTCKLPSNSDGKHLLQGKLDEYE